MDDFGHIETLPIDGVVAGPTAEASGPTPQPVKETSILEMSREGFTFFTPALITTHGKLGLDPAIEFNKTHVTNDESERLFYIDSEYPFFTGLGTSELNGELVNWDHRIYGIVSDNWEPCFAFMSAISGYSKQNNHYFHVGSHNLSIIDPTTFYGNNDISSHLPMFDLTVFCVSTNKHFAWIAPAEQPPVTLSYLQVDPPREETLMEAEIILGPRPEQGDKFNEGLTDEDRDRIAAVNRGEEHKD
jgi:hypothetical protein